MYPKIFLKQVSEPESLIDLDCSDFIKKKFTFLKNTASIPNLLISGPPGSGKTTTVNIFTKEVFGKEHSNLVLKLNTSDNRGIDIIRNRIKDFCRKKTISSKFQIKVIILDEADSLTEIAQEALRRTMERFSNASRFILICNFSSKIIEPIQSRCTIFMFKYPNFEELLNFIIKIFKKKKEYYNLFKIESIIYSSDGDFRTVLKAINFTAIKKLKNLKRSERNFIFYMETVCFPRFFTSCKNKNFYLGSTAIYQLWNEGISGIDIINGLFKTTKNLFIEECVKLKILNLLCEIRLKLDLNISFEKILHYLLGKLKILF